MKTFLASFATRHPVLKLVSLALALGFWFFVHGEQHVEVRAAAVGVDSDAVAFKVIALENVAPGNIRFGAATALEFLNIHPVFAALDLFRQHINPGVVLHRERPAGVFDPADIPVASLEIPEEPCR